MVLGQAHALRPVHLPTLGLQGPSVPCVFPGGLVVFPVFFLRFLVFCFSETRLCPFGVVLRPSGCFSVRGSGGLFVGVFSGFRRGSLLALLSCALASSL